MSEKWVKKWEVQGDSGNFYVVSIDKDGEFGCSCPHWKFRRQQCKHIDFIKENPDYSDDIENIEPKFDFEDSEPLPKLTIKDYYNALNKLDELKQEESQNDQIFKEKEEIIYQRKRRLSNALDNWYYKEQDKIREEKNALEENINQQREPFIETKNQVKRFFDLIDVYLNQKKVQLEICEYSDRDEDGKYIPYKEEKRKIILQPLDIICDDEFKTLAVYIKENNKPKNKYSLILFGYSIFMKHYDGCLLGSDSINWHYYTSRSDIANIGIGIKDGSDKQQLQDYYKKNKDKFAKLILIIHKQVEQEYKTAIEQFQNLNWQIEYWESKKKDFEKSYGRRWEYEKEEEKQKSESYQEYLLILEKINGLKMAVAA